MIVSIRFKADITLSEVAVLLDSWQCKATIFPDGLVAVDINPINVHLVHAIYEQGDIRDYKIGDPFEKQVRGLFTDGD